LSPLAVHITVGFAVASGCKSVLDLDAVDVEVIDEAVDVGLNVDGDNFNVVLKDVDSNKERVVVVAVVENFAVVVVLAAVDGNATVGRVDGSLVVVVDVVVTVDVYGRVVLAAVDDGSVVVVVEVVVVVDGSVVVVVVDGSVVVVVVDGGVVVVVVDGGVVVVVVDGSLVVVVVDGKVVVVVDVVLDAVGNIKVVVADKVAGNVAVERVAVEGDIFRVMWLHVKQQSS
jgi:hypothetical protein